MRFHARGILPVGMGSSEAMDTATILANNQSRGVDARIPNESLTPVRSYRPRRALLTLEAIKRFAAPRSSFGSNSPFAIEIALWCIGVPDVEFEIRRPLEALQLFLDGGRVYRLDASTKNHLTPSRGFFG